MLHSPKTAKGRSQYVIVADHLVMALCRAAWQTWPPKKKLVPRNTKDVEVRFQWASQRMGLPPRGGGYARGATHEYLQGTTVERFLYRGR